MTYMKFANVKRRKQDGGITETFLSLIGCRRRGGGGGGGLGLTELGGNK